VCNVGYYIAKKFLVFTDRAEGCNGLGMWLGRGGRRFIQDFGGKTSEERLLR